jgi:hypothetical protein
VCLPGGLGAGYGYYVAHKTGVIDRMPDIGEQFLQLDTFEL